MGSLLAFPLASPLGGVVVSDIRSEAWGQDQWLIEWTEITVGWDIAFMVAVDGKHYTTVADETSVIIKGESGAAPIVQVVQVPLQSLDPGFFIPGYFDSILNNKIKLTFDPPVSVTDVEKYNVYFDNATGTVDFTTVIGAVEEDGSASYEFITDPLANGTYKFVIRVVDTANNEETNIVETTVVLSGLPGIATGPAVTFNTGPKTATITWTDPADIGAGDVKIFSNGGAQANQFPDYDTGAEIGTVAAGVQTFTTAALSDGVYVFGLRVFDGTNRETNTNVLVFLRVESGAEVASYPPKPVLQAENAAGGTVNLLALVDPISALGEADRVQFFTNDGAGGAIDFGTPLSPGFVNLVQRGNWHYADLTTAAFGETVRKFAARSFTSTGTVSVNSDELTITPDATAPGVAQNIAGISVRD